MKQRKLSAAAAPVLFLALPLCALSASAQPTVTYSGSTPTQAIVSIRNQSGNCKLELSESSSFAPLHPDVDPSLYGGSNVDVNRPDTIAWTDGSRVVTLGHQTDDRALAAATTYYLRVSGCGGTTSISFTTPTLGVGTTMQWPAPFNASKWGNLGYPTIDLLNRKTYVDPTSGVKLRPMNLAGDWGWRAGGTWDATYPFNVSGSYQFADYTGGTGWSNPGSITSGSSTSATTGGTSPIDLYLVPENPWTGYRTFDDLGIVLWGGASSGSAPDNQIEVCIFLNPTQGCIGTPMLISLPKGSAQQLASKGADPDHPFPSTFPGPMFAGWGINDPIRSENRATYGSLSGSNGVLTIQNPDVQQHFSDGHTAGNRIKIVGSGCQPNDMCTIASFTNAGSIRTVEPVNVSGANFTSYGMGVRIWKLTSNGTVTVGARYKPAGSRTMGLQAGTPPCGYVAATSGDGKTGFVCEVDTPINGGDLLYFVASDGTIRKFSMLLVPQHQGVFASWPANDRPTPGGNVPLYPVGYDQSDPKTFYAAMQNAAGSFSVFKLSYTGDFTQDLDFQFSAGIGGDTPDNFTPALDHMVWSNLMPPSQGKDLDTQIKTSYPNYNVSVYGDWKSGVNFAGVSANKAIFYKAYDGQDQGPAWIAIVDLPSGIVSNMIHTADGTGTNGYIQWGSIHTVQSLPAVPNGVLIGDNLLNSNNSSKLHGGPFTAQVTGVLRGGAWSATTNLPWPPDSTYDNACPSGNVYAFIGATGNQCVTIRLPKGGACNVAPAAIEKSTWPCPWNANYAQPFALKVGAVMGNAAGGTDDEKFRVISISTEPDSQLRVVLQRNSMWDYCCVTGTHTNNGVSNCVDNAGQNTHANGWSVMMYPGTLNGCASGVFVLDASANSIGEIGRLQQAHGTFAAGLTSGNLSYLTSTALKANAPLSQLFSLPTTIAQIDPPAYQGIYPPGGLLQSYVARISSSKAVDPSTIPWMLDSNTLNAGSPGGWESLNNSISQRSLTKVGTDIYKIQVLGNVAYKVFPLVGWAGRFNLKDVSALGSDLTSAPYYSMCYAYTAGECYSGSSANDVFVKVPNAIDTGACVVGISWANTPCVVSGLAAGGGIRQQGLVNPASGGGTSRFLTYSLAAPGQHYPYTTAAWLTDGQTAILPGSHSIGGWGPMGFLMALPPWQTDTVPRNSLLTLQFTVTGGSAYAEVQFGYSRWGLPSQLYCTARAEACNSSVPANGVFNFESERRSLTSCTNGCTIDIPVISTNIVYFRVRRSNDGVNWTADNIQAYAVP